MGTSIDRGMKPHLAKVGLFVLMFLLMYAPSLMATGDITYNSDKNQQELVGNWLWAGHWFFIFVGIIGLGTGAYLFNDGKQKQGIIIIIFGLAFFKMFDYIVPFLPKNSGKVGTTQAAQE
jgi:TRAP-type uncharacterized transport system fused permease subunit